MAESGKEQKEMIKAPEFEPPQACIQRIVKAVLPDNVQIGKDAKAAFARAAGIFIMYLTACANDFCRESKRQTVSGSDVMMAISELEFHEMVEPLKEFLEQMRAEATAKKESRAEKAAAEEAAAVEAATAAAPAAEPSPEPEPEAQPEPEQGQEPEPEPEPEPSTEVEPPVEEGAPAVPEAPPAENSDMMS